MSRPVGMMGPHEAHATGYARGRAAERARLRALLESEAVIEAEPETPVETLARHGRARVRTQQAAAADLGISPQYLCDLLAGRRGFSAEIAARLETRWGWSGREVLIWQATEDLGRARAALAAVAKRVEDA